MVVVARTARRAALAAVVGATALLVAACSPPRPASERVLATVPVAGGGADAVPWHEYAPGVRARIDDWAARGDCERLADTRDEAAGRVTPAGGAALVAYLDRALRAAGCG